MKNVVIYATCQRKAVGDIMAEHDDYLRGHNKPTVILNYGRIITNNPVIADSKARRAVEVADVFVYQPLPDKYGLHATSNVLSLLRPGCIKIAIPYITFGALWPIFESYGRDLTDSWLGDDKEIIYGGEPLDAIDTYDEAIQKFNNGEIYWAFGDRQDKAEALLRSREEITDIKVMDFIKENIHDHRMFTFFSHPSTKLTIYLANQVLERMGVVPSNKTYPENNFYPPQTLRLYPTCSVNYYGLRFVPKAEMELADEYCREVIEKYKPWPDLM